MSRKVQRKTGGELQPLATCFLCGPVEKAVHQDNIWSV